MELEKIFENSFANVQYDRENKVLRSTYTGLVNADLGVESFQAVLNELPKYPLRGAVFNCLEMKGTFTKLNPWLNSVWYPAIIPQGYICWSLATTDVFSRFAASMLIDKLTPKEITAKLFGTLEKAEDWTYSFLKNAEK